MRIVNHWLQKETDAIRHHPTPNLGQPFAPNMPDTLVLHYTAMDTPQQALNLLCSPQHQASAHVLVTRQGVFIQLAPFNTITWHAGESQHQQRTQLNHCSLGIEMDNAGRLEKHQDHYCSWQRHPYAFEETLLLTHRNEKTPCYWHRYTFSQIRAVRQLCQLLLKTYDIQHILGHEEISPNRKYDPGPAFPLNILRQLF